MFSSRLHWDLRPNAISARLAEMRSAGLEILDLTESNPTNAAFATNEESLLGAFLAGFNDKRILRYDPSPLGMFSARQAVSEYYNGDVDPDRLLLTASTSEAYGFLFKLLTDPGDEILVPRPSYPLFDFLAGMELVKLVPYPLAFHGRWEIDFDALEALATPRTRAMVLVNPNNPTGSFLHADERGPLIDFCARRGLAILSDEVFSDYAFAPDANRVESLRGAAEVLTFCMGGLSKAAAMPQMKLGWTAVSGPERLRRPALERLELIADTYLSVGTPVQAAAAKLLAAGADLRSRIRARTARNLAHLRAAIPVDSPLSLLPVEGGWYAIVEVPKIRTEEEWVLTMLERCGVLMQPGFFYDFASEAFLVISLLTPEPVFDAGAAHLVTQTKHAS